MPGQTAEQNLQQKRNARAAGGGGTDDGGNQLAAAPTPQAAVPQMPPRTQTPGSAYGDKWQDAFPGTSGYGKPARPGQQSWFDWFSKSYNQTPSDAAIVAGDAASYGLAPRAVQGMQYLHNTPLGTAMPIPQGWTPGAAQQSIQEAYDRLGPGSLIPQGVGYAASPLTWAGVGPVGKLLGKGMGMLLPEAVSSSVATKVLPSAIAKNVPEDIVPRMVQSGNFAGTASAGSTYGQGGSPAQAGEAYLKNFPVGAGLETGISTIPMGARTPAQVTQSTQATLDALGNPIIPRKNLGFAISSGPGQFRGDPTLADVEAIRKMLLTEATPKGYSPPTPSATGTVPTGYRSSFDTQLKPEEPGYGRGPSPTAGDATVGSPELQQNVRPPSAAGGTIQDILLNKIANALPQSLDANYQQAMQQAQNAKTLEGLRSNAGLPGFNVRQQAAQEAQNYPPGSPQNTSFQDIARVPDQVGKVISPGARSAMVGTGGALGEAASYATGVPHLGAGFAWAGNQAANIADWLGTPKSPTHAIRQTIDQQYPALTGWGVGPGANQDLSGALMKLYGPGPFGSGPGYSQ